MAVQKKTWEEFRKTGLFHFVNAFLHIFGWVIVLAIKDNGEVAEVYPACPHGLAGIHRGKQHQGIQQCNRVLGKGIWDGCSEGD